VEQLLNRIDQFEKEMSEVHANQGFGWAKAFMEMSEMMRELATQVATMPNSKPAGKKQEKEG
jgi:hypothetical protein